MGGIDVESQSKKGLFMQFDLNGDGSIEIDEFASALQSVHGNARSIDMMVLKHENKLLKKEFRELASLVKHIANNVGSLKEMPTKAQQLESYSSSVTSFVAT